MTVYTKENSTGYGLSSPAVLIHCYFPIKGVCFVSSVLWVLTVEVASLIAYGSQDTTHCVSMQSINFCQQHPAGFLSDSFPYTPSHSAI